MDTKVHQNVLFAAILVFLLIADVTSQEADQSSRKPIKLPQGVQLLIDDHLIARSEGMTREVQPPKRFLDGPIVTGEMKHQNWQPFLTVLHDAKTEKNPYRMWYNVDVVDDPDDGNFFGKTGYLESADGIHWPGPYERLNSLTEDGRVRFGACVLDDGPGHRPIGERFKMLYFDAGKLAGPRVAFSADGRQWNLHDGGRPILRVNNGDDIWSAGYDPIRQRYFLFGKSYGPYTWINAEGKQVTATIRRYYMCFSRDFKTWSEPKMVFSPDEGDEGITQWYGPAGFLVRGDLIVGFLRVLRDDLSPEGVPDAAVDANTRGHAGLGASGLGDAGGSGMGYTVLTWTRDGETWHRDRHSDKFLQPDPKVGAWDHAMAWIGSSTPVGDDVYLYYAGYRWGHKYHHSTDRQIGVVKLKRDRYVARCAGELGGTFTTREIKLAADAITLNVDAEGGSVSVQVIGIDGNAIPGFRHEDCRPISKDALAAPVTWARPLSDLGGQTVCLEFSLQNARLFAFETH